MKFGDRIKELLAEKNMMQKELGKRIGVTEATISRWVANDREPKVGDIVKIAKALDCSADYLFGLQEKQRLEEQEEMEAQEAIKYIFNFFHEKEFEATPNEIFRLGMAIGVLQKEIDKKYME